jgi:two-component system KDP operon response regulator KdpE
MFAVQIEREENDQMKLLLVEDDPLLGRSLENRLHSAGFVVDRVVTGEEAEAAVATSPYPLAILDRRLPDGDGVSRIAALRRFQPDIRVIVLTALDATLDKIGGLDAGADDYLTKPFSLPELMARIRVAQRHAARAEEKEESVHVFGDLRVDLGNRVVTRGKEDVRLTPVEYKLLATLVRNAGKVMTYQQLLKEVWGLRYANQKQYLHVYVGHLRSKLEDDPARPRFLLTEPGVGYRFKAD